MTKKFRPIFFGNIYLCFIFILLAAVNVHADQPWSTTVDGRLFIKGTTTPLTKNVAFKLQIVNPSGSCLLYEESQSYDTTLTSGYFNLKIGTDNPDSTSKRTASDPGFAMTKIFNNIANSFPVSVNCPSGYVPSSGDSRYLRVTVQPAGEAAEVLSPNIALNSVPSAQVANSLSGLGRGDVLQVNTASGVQLDQSNLESIFNSTQLPVLNSILAGTSNLYEKHASNGTTTIPSVSAPAAPSAGQMWYDSGVLKYYNGSAIQTLGAAGSGIQSLTAGTGLLGGTISSSGTISVDVGTAAGKIVQLDGTAKLPAVDGSALTNLNGSEIQSGTIGGSTAVNTTGNISAQNVSATGANFRTLTLTNATSQSLTLQPPAAITGSPLTFTLPGSTGIANQVLTTNGAGVLSWTTPTSATVTSVSGTAPIQVANGATAPVISIDAATTTSSGVVTLASDGGTTANTVVQANDSRLTNVRSPIGTALNSGQLWVGGVTNLATAVSVSGDASLSNNGALTLANSGATAGTYTKVTIDAKGRVTSNGVTNISDVKSSVAGNWFTATGSCNSGEQLTYSSVSDSLSCQAFALTSSQVTTALGFTPANGASYVAKTGDTMSGALNLPSNGLAVGTSQLVVSGGNVGIGTTAPSAQLDVRSASSGIQLVLSDENTDATNKFSRFGATHYLNAEKPLAITVTSNTSSQSNIMFGGGSSVMNAATTLAFYTGANNTTTTGSERMRISSSGYVGIGTTNPASLLHVGAGAAISIPNGAGTSFSPQIQNSQTSGVAGLAVGINDGVNNRRAGLFVDQTNSAWGLSMSYSSGGIPFVINNAGTEQFRITNAGNVGIGTNAPTSYLHLKAGSAAAGSAPLKLTAGTNLTTPENGAVEFDGTNLFFTSGGTRRSLASTTGTGTLSGVDTISNATGSITMTPSSGNSLIVDQTTTSTSSSTGALVVNGGTGIAGVLNVAGNIVGSANITATTALYSPVIYGGTTASQNLTLDSTSNATKGNILLAPAGGNIAIGAVGTPTSKVLVGASQSASLNSSAGIIIDQMGTTNNNYTTLGFSWAQSTGNYTPLAGLSFRGTSYGSGTGDLAIFTGGSNERLTITNTGNVGIGTTNPSNLLSLSGSGVQFSISNPITTGYSQMALTGTGRTYQVGVGNASEAAYGVANKWFVYDNSAGMRMVLDASGNVGIGTSSPQGLIHVENSAGAAAAYITSSATTAAQINLGQPGQRNAGLITYSNATNSMAFHTNASEKLRIESSGNVGIGTTSPGRTLDVSGVITATGIGAPYTTGSWARPLDLNHGSAIVWKKGAASESWGIGKTNSPSSSFSIFTSAADDNSAAANTMLTILNSGNVGIGTTSPSLPLHVNSSANGAGSVIDVARFNQSGGAVGDGARLLLGAGGTNAQAGIAGIVPSSGNSNLALYVTSSGTMSEALRINASGNVGIGTTSPSGLLSVGATSQFTVDSSGNITAPGVVSSLAGLVTGGSGSQYTIRRNVDDNLLNIAGGSSSALGGNIILNGSTSATNPNVIRFRNSSTEAMRIDASGNVGIGTTSPGYKLDVQGGDINASGSVRAAGVALTSDIRYKRDIEPLDHALEKILNIRGVSYNWRTEEFPQKHFNDRHQVGVIAQEVEQQFPEVVDTNKDGYKSVNYPALVAPLIEAVKTLYNRLAGVEATQVSQAREIASKADTAVVDAKVQRLEAENAKLKQENVAIKSWICSKDPKAAICK